MINEDKAKAAWILHMENSCSLSEISKKLNIDRKTVNKIIKNEGIISRKERSDKLVLNNDLIIKTFKRCDEWGERTHEELENLGVKVAYSTLMKKLKELNLKENKKPFSTPVPDVPGEESQHDLSPYKIKIGDKIMNIQASYLHYRYSKMGFLKFYPSFNRFNMKCFFHEALNYFGYVPRQCVIDNTSLVILRGSGQNAVFNHEMIDFAKGFEFKWIAHEIKHSDRKAGVERSFWTIETNFFPGRDFSSLENLNDQAKEWLEKRSKKMNKNKIIPIDYFEYEKDYMKKVIPKVLAPYRQHARIIDQEGYVLFETNSYWIGIQRHLKVMVLEYSDRIKIYHQRKCIREYKLPLFGIRSQKIQPDGVTIPYRPKKYTIPSHSEEKELIEYSQEAKEYLRFALKTHGPQNRYQLIRQIYFLYKNLSPSIFDKMIARALKYKINTKGTLEKIAVYIVNKENLSDSEMNHDYDFSLEQDISLSEIDNYSEGLYSSSPNLKSYDEKWGGESND